MAHSSMATIHRKVQLEPISPANQLVDGMWSKVVHWIGLSSLHDQKVSGREKEWLGAGWLVDGDAVTNGSEMNSTVRANLEHSPEASRFFHWHRVRGRRPVYEIGRSPSRLREQ